MLIQGALSNLDHPKFLYFTCQHWDDASPPGPEGGPYRQRWWTSKFRKPLLVQVCSSWLVGSTLQTISSSNWLGHQTTTTSCIRQLSVQWTHCIEAAHPSDGPSYAQQQIWATHPCDGLPSQARWGWWLAGTVDQAGTSGSARSLNEGDLIIDRITYMNRFQRKEGDCQSGKVAESHIHKWIVDWNLTSFKPTICVD